MNEAFLGRTIRLLDSAPTAGHRPHAARPAVTDRRRGVLNYL